MIIFLFLQKIKNRNKFVANLRPINEETKNYYRENDDEKTERLLYEEIVYVYFTRITFTCTLRGIIYVFFYEEMIYVLFTRKGFTCSLRRRSLRVFYEEMVYVAFTRKLLTPLYDERFPCKVTTN